VVAVLFELTAEAKAAGGGMPGGLMALFGREADAGGEPSGADGLVPRPYGGVWQPMGVAKI
jgi:hypothetical protein